MTFIPFDIGTYLVKSRTRDGEAHLLNLLGNEGEDDPWGCSCEGYEFSEPFNTCAHYREALRRRRQGRLPMIVAMKGRA